MSLTILVVCSAAVALFLTLLLSLGFQPRFLTKMAGVLLLVAGILGVLFYGYGYCVLCKNIPQAIARTLFSVFCMFLGRNEIDAISAVPLLRKPVMQIGLYFTHLLALYCTASAVVATIGARLIRTMNLLLLRHGDLYLIYGVSDDTLEFAGKLPNRTRIIFVDPGNETSLEPRILQMGGLMLTDEAARSGSPEFLRRIGVGTNQRKLSVYCLADEPAENYRYAAALLRSLDRRGVESARTSLTVILPDAEASAALQACPEHSGYGTVTAYERAELISRLMVRAFPPCDTLRFDGTGRAAENFEALIVGFGKTGQAVLRALVMNGQFAGSRFHATVVARDTGRQAGSFFSRYPALREQYDITFLDADARSVTLYEQLARIGPDLNYVALCTGSESTDAELAVEYARLFQRLGIAAPILQCEAAYIRKNADRGGPAKTVSVYSPDILCGQSLDEIAMAINHRYHLRQPGTAKTQWAECDYFSRMSCRASADYLRAFLRAAGRGAEKEAAALRPTEELLETLSEMEHARWCAFHFAMGYRPMPEEIWRKRAEQYLQRKAAGETPLRIGKDASHRMHACLIDWAELNELSKRENEITGGHVDYQQLDRDNVTLLLELVRGDRKEGREDA